MRDSILFMGSGDYSTAQCYDLVQKLMDGFVLLSSIQQPMHWNHEPSNLELAEEEAYRVDANERLEEIARDIAMALTGKKIEFKDE